MEVLKNKRVFALIGMICLLIGTIAPYYKFSLLGYSYSISLWKYWEGKIIIALIVANTMFIFKDLLKKYVPQVFASAMGQKIENASPKISIIPTILVVVFVVYLTTSLSEVSEYLEHGIGFYALWVGIVGLVGHAIFYKESSSKAEKVEYTEPLYNPSQNIKVCPSCGNKVGKNATTCFMCGQNL